MFKMQASLGNHQQRFAEMIDARPRFEDLYSAALTDDLQTRVVLSAQDCFAVQLGGLAALGLGETDKRRDSLCGGVAVGAGAGHLFARGRVAGDSGGYESGECERGAFGRFVSQAGQHCFGRSDRRFGTDENRAFVSRDTE